MAVVDALVTHFLNVEMFRGLKPLQITEIARRAERVVFRAGQPLIEHGHAGDAALLVVSEGAVRTRGPDDQPCTEPIEPGSLIGEMTMLINTEHTSTVMAQGSVRAFRITRDSLASQMEQDAALAEHFVEKIAGRLQRLATELKRIESSLSGDTSAKPANGNGQPASQQPAA
jgi:CRP-like cAMP-binding protein